jgi:hypothetical protein
MTAQSKIQNRLAIPAQRTGKGGHGDQVSEENQAAMPGLN